MDNNSDSLSLIRGNIAEHGYHVYIVSGGALPRYIYTIGNTNRFGSELVFAGGAFYSAEIATHVIDEISSLLTERKTRSLGSSPTNILKGFNLRPVDPTWVEELMLGATDFYGLQPISALQIVPDLDRITLDTPDMTAPFSPTSAPAWRWLCEPWPFSIPESSVAMTNLAALRGESITEAVRWEQTDWELFAGHGPNVHKSDMRAVALGTLLGCDPTLEPVTRISIGKGLWRERKGTAWQAWGK